MEALTFSAYSYGGYPGYIPVYQGNPKFKHQNWNKKGVYGVVPEIPDYFEICKRAQLKAILSQVNPNLTPRLRKANTKDFGVQVNPKVNATVQCSLGPKTLFYREDNWDSPKTGSPLRPSLPSTPLNNVRFSRPVAIYSPVFDRRFFSLPARAYEPAKDAKLNSSEEENCASEVEKRETEAGNVRVKARQYAASQSRTPTRFNFQFLEQKYGYYHCSKCNIRWESAYVWCISGTCKVYFKQHCRKCQAGLNPYSVESIQCQIMSKKTSQRRCWSEDLTEVVTSDPVLMNQCHN